jgi:PAS domain S-box-containing protein
MKGKSKSKPARSRSSSRRRVSKKRSGLPVDHPYRVLAETIGEGTALLDDAGTVLYANAPCAEILGVPLARLAGTLLQSHVASHDRDAVAELIRKGLRGQVRTQLSLVLDNVRRRLVRLSFSRFAESGPRKIAVVVTELTELLETNVALKASEDVLRQLSARLLQLQDEERRRIARDLHDVTGQKLAFQSIVLSQLVAAAENSADAKSRSALAECLGVTQQISEEIRTLSYLLHPPLLDELGLASAVPWYTQGFETRTGIRVIVDIPRDLVRLPPDVEVTLFRVIQESLTNVHRYSGSSTASIRLSADANEVTLKIGDAGRGIRGGGLHAIPGAAAGLGVGIQGMRERMRQLGGRLEITADAAQGTVVTAVLPIPEPQPLEVGEWGGGTDEPGDGRLRILVADDHEVLRHGVRLILKDEPNWEICGEASDGKEAVDKTLALNPDVVIVDIHMPTLNGLEIVRQIVEHRPSIKLLVFTVEESEQTVSAIAAAGAHAYLSKAQAGQELVSALKKLLAGENSFPSVAVRA